MEFTISPISATQRDKVFITFGGPTPNFHKRVNAIVAQATQSGLFTKIKGFTESDLKRDREYWEKHGEFIASNHRGYGYWAWKPFVVKKTMDRIKDNDILVYCDAGCYLNITENSKKRMEEYVELLDNSPYGIVSFQMTHVEDNFTKRATYEAINDNPADLKSGQCMATVVLLRKTPHSVMVVNEWFRHSHIYNLINDVKDPSRPENPAFYDHRHDQSILSLLVKKHGSVKIPDETYFGPYWADGANFPFFAARIRG
jgi:hypothetical protein